MSRRKSHHPPFALLATVLALIIGTPLVVCHCSSTPKRPNIILISIDTLRADRLGCYGNQAGLTGMMDFWAERGIRFANAYAPSPWTLPSHASLFTGLYPTEHLAIDENINIGKDIPLIGEFLFKIGYRTGAFVSHYYLAKDYGFGRGFEDFFIRPNANAEDIIRKADNWIDKHKDEPFFLFLHLFDPHTPYQPPVDLLRKHYPKDVPFPVTGDTKDVLDVIWEWPSEEAKQKLKALSALYDGEIEFVDRQLAVLHKSLLENGLDRKTAIILVSDHGEEFMEHGLMEHGYTLYQEQIRVPFLWYYPAADFPSGLTIEEPVSLIDILPTLLSFLGIPGPEKISGRDLMPLIRGEIQALDRPLLAETTRQGPDRVAVMHEAKKYVYSPEFELNNHKFSELFFDLAQDPEEKNNLLTDAPEAANALKSELFGMGLYMQRRIWHVRWGETDNKQIIEGDLRTDGEFIYHYKDNTIYGTDEQRSLITKEFPWDKRGNARIHFFSKPHLANGLAFMTEPEIKSQVTFNFLINNKEQPELICLGDCDHHPESGNFTLQKPIKLTGDDQPPPGHVLIWSDNIWVNAKQVLRHEIGDPIRIDPKTAEELRSLGYIN